MQKSLKRKCQGEQLSLKKAGPKINILAVLLHFSHLLEQVLREFKINFLKKSHMLLIVRNDNLRRTKNLLFESRNRCFVCFK